MFKDSQTEPTESVEHRSAEIWVQRIRNTGGSMLFAPVSGNWRINGKPLSADRDYQATVDTQILLRHNIKEVGGMMNPPISFQTLSSGIRPEERDATNFLVVGPLIQGIRTFTAGEVLRVTDRPQETLFVINIISSGPGIEKPSRGSHQVLAKVLLPKSTALQLVEQIKKDPNLLRELLYSLYQGIDSREITHAPRGLTIFFHPDYSENPGDYSESAIRRLDFIY